MNKLHALKFEKSPKQRNILKQNDNIIHRLFLTVLNI